MPQTIFLTEIITEEGNLAMPHFAGNRTLLSNFARILYTAILVALICCFWADEAKAEGDYWIPLYNKLVYMLNERCSVAGIPGIEYADATEPVGPWMNKGTTLQNQWKYFGGLSLMRKKIVELATEHYVRHLDADGDNPITLDGREKFPMWIEYADPTTTDKWGNKVIAGEFSRTFFDMIREKGPDSLKKSICPDNGTGSWTYTSPDDSRNGFCRIPTSYGQESFSSIIAPVLHDYEQEEEWGNRQNNDFIDVPVLWEHFQEIYQALLLLKYTKTGGEWQIPQDAEGNPMDNGLNAYGIGDTWMEAQALDDSDWGSQDTFVDENITPKAIYSGHCRVFDPPENGVTQYYEVNVELCRGKFQIIIPTLRESTVRFFAFAERPSAGDVRDWDSNGDPVEENKYKQWNLYSYSPSLLPDDDEDGIRDDWEVAKGLDPTDPADADLDSDPDEYITFTFRELFEQEERTIRSAQLGTFTIPTPCSKPTAIVLPGEQFGDGENKKGYKVTNTVAILEWTSFTDWEDIEPAAITEADFFPLMTDGPDQSLATENLCKECSGCQDGICEVGSSLPTTADTLPDWDIPLGLSDATESPQVQIAIRTSRSKFPLSGLWFNRSMQGTYLFLTCELRHTIYNRTITTHVNGTPEMQHFTKILRENGRIITFLVDSDGEGKPVGPDTGLKKLVIRNGKMHFLKEGRKYHGIGDDHVGWENQEFVDASGDEPGVAPGIHIDWTNDRLTLPGYTIEVERDAPGGTIQTLTWLRDSDSMPVYKVELAASIPLKDENGNPRLRDDGSAIVKPFATQVKRYRNDALTDPATWTEMESHSFARDDDENWTADHRKYGHSPYLYESQTEIGNTIVLSRKSSVNGPERKVSYQYVSTPWGMELAMEADYDLTVSPVPDLKPTMYSYYTDAANDGGAFGHLKRIDHPDGSWEKYEYNSDGLTSKVVRGFLDAADSSGTTRTTEYLYASVDPWLGGTYTPAPDCKLAAPPTGVSPDDGNICWYIPRTVIEKISGNELSRTYRIIRSYQEQTILACPGAAVDDTANLVTVSSRDSSSGRLVSTTHPDGTATSYQYSIASGLLTTTVANPAGTSTTVSDDRGRTHETASTRDGSSALFSNVVYSNEDPWGHFTQASYLDATTSTTLYACCGPSKVTARDGTVTEYGYDDAGRVFLTERNGISTVMDYDVDGNATSSIRVGTDGSNIVFSTASYDDYGRQTSAWNPSSGTTIFTRSFTGADGQQSTTTSSNEGTRVETYYRDARLKEISGSAVNPVRYEYGVEEIDGIWCEYTKTIRVGAGGAEAEWTKSFSDPFGRSFLTVYADGAQSESFYNSLGQLIRTVDPDGATTLYAYNSDGERDITALDLNGNDIIDYDADRITRTESDVTVRTTPEGDVTVARNRSWLWKEGSATADDGTLVSASETSADGTRSWSASFGREASTISRVDAATKTRTVQSTAPDGTCSVSTTIDGRLASTENFAADGSLLRRTTYGYDAHGRQSTVTVNPGAGNDERVTTYAYKADSDQIASVTVEGYDPDGTPRSETTSYGYDIMGRRIQTTLPGAVVQNTDYNIKGQVAATYGDNQYPVEYAYDPQGRMTSMTTFKDFAGNSGSATTTWIYDAQRGWLNRKEYADGKGADYTYTAAGRLETRTWARGLATTYYYDSAGRQVTVNYSDTTPDITYTYYRDGSAATIADASGTRALTYNADGSSDAIAYDSGPLAGHLLNYAIDGIGRPDGYILSDGTGNLADVSYGYDPDSGLLAAVADGSDEFAYTYADNFPGRLETVRAKHDSIDVITTTKTYDGLNRLSAISTENAAASLVSSHAYDYNAKSQRIKSTLADGSYWEYSYDNLGQVTGGVKYNATGTPIPGMSFGYAFDDIGNRQSSTASSFTTSYTSNALNQYSAIQNPGIAHVRGKANDAAIVGAGSASNTPVANAQRLNNTFYIPLPVDNAAGPYRDNIKIMAVMPGGAPGGEDLVSAETRSVAVPQASQTIAYDDDGNMLSDGIWTYAWNAENRMIAAESADKRITFAYDSQGRRFQKTVYTRPTPSDLWSLTSNLRFIYDGWNLIAELDATDSNALVRTHLWGMDLSGSMQGAGGVGGLLATTVHAIPSTTCFPAYDGNGNVTAYVDASTGANSATFDYDPFGNTVVAEIADDGKHLKYRFSTKYLDETGLYYYGARSYSPELGRWINRDPIEENGGVNVLGFVGNRGISLIDFLGMFDKNETYTNSDIEKELNRIANISIIPSKSCFYTGGYKVTDTKPIKKPLLRSYKEKPTWIWKIKPTCHCVKRCCTTWLGKKQYKDSFKKQTIYRFLWFPATLKDFRKYNSFNQKLKYDAVGRITLGLFDEDSNKAADMSAKLTDKFIEMEEITNNFENPVTPEMAKKYQALVLKYLSAFDKSCKEKCESKR